MIPLHKIRSDEEFTECNKRSGSVNKCIVIDETDAVKKDPRNYIEHFQKVSKDNSKYVLCDSCWITYDSICHMKLDSDRFLSESLY